MHQTDDELLEGTGAFPEEKEQEAEATAEDHPQATGLLQELITRMKISISLRLKQRLTRTPSRKQKK